MPSSRALFALAVAVATAATGSAVASADDKPEGFRTSQPAMVTLGDRSDVTITPLITVGETLAGGYRFESIPDGISVDKGERGRGTLYVNHETSTVPFPYVPADPTAANGENDFDNAQLSRLVVDGKTATILSGKMVIASVEGFQRFCSNFLATSKQGFDRDILFTNEEAIEWVNTAGRAWPSAQGAPGARQSGVVVAYDPKSGKRQPIWGMGRHNHENSVAVPGFKDIVVLSGDDTFLTNPAQSQVYAYIARNSRDVWADKGDLWAFVSDTAGFDDYYDFVPGSTQSISGHFVKVPKDIATGRVDGTGRDLMAADKGYAAPLVGEFAADALGLPTDGPQYVLQKWGDVITAFRFVRIEDIAYDKRPGQSNVVYLADSGRASTGAPAAGKSTNGRIWKMVFDRKDPTKVVSLSILVEGDDNPVKTLGEIHQPDNLETTRASLFVTEDPSSSQQFPFGSTDPAATTARLWRVPLEGAAAPEVAVKVDQSADGGPTDVDGRAPGSLGAWETSGIVDASSVFGSGAFLLDVQAHTLWVEKGDGDDLNGNGAPDWTNKREGGQLVLVRVPGA